jgi:hypothetical protein
MKKNKLTLAERRNLAKLTLPPGPIGWTGVLKGTHKKETYDKFGIPTLRSEVIDYLTLHPISTKYLIKTHPEILRNEVFIINVKDNEDFETNLPNFIESTRRGNIAYTSTGEVVPDMKPLFAVLKAISNTRGNIKIETGAGDWFPKVAEKAQHAAKHIIKIHGKTIAEFDFNGIKCVVDKDTNLEWLERDYHNAHTMEWKVIGPECYPVYELEVQVELDRREKAREEKAEANSKAYRAKEDTERKLFEEKIEGIEIELIDKKGWDDWKANQKDDGYGLAIFEYAEFWAKRMQKEFADRNIENPDVACMVAHADNCANELNFLGITGFMYGAAVVTLAKCWKHGEALRKWHNKEWGVVGGEGVVNPAMFTITK